METKYVESKTICNVCFKVVKVNKLLKRIDNSIIKYKLCRKIVINSFDKQYWIDKGFTEEESKNILTKNSTRNIEYFINKYGINEGTIKYSNMCKKIDKLIINKTNNLISELYI